MAEDIFGLAFVLEGSFVVVAVTPGLLLCLRVVALVVLTMGEVLLRPMGIALMGVGCFNGDDYGVGLRVIGLEYKAFLLPRIAFGLPGSDLSVAFESALTSLLLPIPGLIIRGRLIT